VHSTVSLRPKNSVRRSSPRPAAPAASPHPQLANEDVARVFEEIAELLAISAENPFRIRAYQRAAQVVRTLPRPCAELGDAAALEQLPGIGADLAAKIQELLRTGSLRVLTRLRSQVPASLRELLRLPGLGPVRARALHTIGVDSIAQLRQALAQHRLEKLRGFGPVLRRRLQETLESPARALPGRWLWSVAGQYAEPLRAYLLSLPGVAAVQVCGSYRRGRDTVGDLDIVVSSPGKLDLARALRAYPEVSALSAAGPTRCTLQLRCGLQVDLRLVVPESMGAAVYYFTGSRDHNVQLRLRAAGRGLKLNEYGLFRGRRRIAGAQEQDILRALQLPWIAPELRERRGEIEAAERGALPHLLELPHLQGDLHVHTDASDGHSTLGEMVTAARQQGLRYIAITDHAQHMGMVHGLDGARLERQADHIDENNASLVGFQVLKGAEVDILEDGQLALPDAVLRRLEVVLIAIHSHFDLPPERQTRRLLRALERPGVLMLAHPTGRLLGQREACRFDFNKVIDALQARHGFLELDSQPQRLDADDLMCRAARERGVLISVDSDAHSTLEFANLQGGVRQARRGWLQREDVLNTRSLPELRGLLARGRA
jgi:DNA polymerase (family X)